MEPGPVPAPVIPFESLGLSRRQLFMRAGALSAMAGFGRAFPALAGATPEAATPAAGDLTGLLRLSQELCGGGTFDPARGEPLLSLLSEDAELKAGLAHLLAQSPLDPPALGKEGQAAATAILVYWYAGAFDSQPVSDRSTAFYSLTAWQAMYTFPTAVCRGFGTWTDAPKTDPLTPANS